MTFSSLTKTIRTVQAVYPHAIAEFPEQLCSISSCPGGAPISQACRNAKAAWIDAGRRLKTGPARSSTHSQPGIAPGRVTVESGC